MLIGDSFDEIFFHLVNKINSHPQFVSSPRGQKVRESLVVTLELTNPRARLLSVPARKADYGFGVGEFLWYWSGRQDLESLLYYNKRAKDFSNDGQTVNSAYGYRLCKEVTLSQFSRRKGSAEIDNVAMNLSNHSTQWEVAVQTLLQDPDSRRCVLHSNRPFDQEQAVNA